MKPAAVVLLALGLVLAPAGSTAGAQDAEALTIEQVDAGQHPSVTVTVTAPPALAGRDVPPKAFAVTEAGQPRPFAVERLPSDELSVLLVVDTSGSMQGTPMAAAKQAAVGFIDQIPPGVRVSVMGFSDRPGQPSAFSTDRRGPRRAVRRLQAGGETALYDAVSSALHAFPDDADGLRKSIVLLSDGGDTASTAALRQVTDELAASDVSMQVVELRSGERDQRALGRLAAAARGGVVAADDPTALAGAYDTIASQLVNQYLVAYASAAHGPTRLQVELNWNGVKATAHRTIQLPAAPPDGTEDPELRVVAVDTDEYPEVAVTVVAPRALSEEELARDAFVLSESDTPLDIDVRRVPGIRIEVVLAIDTSGSMEGQPLAAAKAAAKSFLRQVPAGARVAVVAFDDEPEVISPFSDSAAAREDKIERLQASGGTALYDAARTIAALFEGRLSATRSVILLSDGGDTVSESSLEAAAGALAGVKAGLYTVQLDSPETDHRALVGLTEPADGRVVAATDDAGLQQAYEDLAVDVGNQYVIRYRSLTHGLAELHVEVEHGGVRAETERAVELPPPPWPQTFMGSRWGLVLGAAIMYLALGLFILILLAPRERTVVLSGASGGGSRGRRRSGLAEIAERAAGFAERQLQQRGWSGPLNTALERAGINLRPGEFTVLLVSASLAGLAFGALIGGLAMSLLLAVVPLLAAKLLLKVASSRREAKFAEQLPDVLQLLAGSLRAGYGLMQAVDAVAREAGPPASEEFRRLVLETRLGRDLDDALTAMAARLDNEDFGWVVQAIEINREVGGDLAGVLDNVAATIREREQIRRQIKALSAEGRLSAYILLALPFFVGFLMYMSNPEYPLELVRNGPIGFAMLGVGAVLMTVGAVWTKRIARLVF